MDFHAQAIRKMAVLSVFLSGVLAFSAELSQNVILITLDGVRWQEFFHGTDPSVSKTQTQTELFSHFWKTIAPQGVAFGDCDAQNSMVVANPVFRSLPAYHSILSGGPQDCRDNDCGRIRVETLQERLVRELHFSSQEVATIASWEKIKLSSEQKVGTTFVNAGMTPLIDEQTEPELDRLNQQQQSDPPPWSESRLDQYTFAQGLRYLVVHRPRFLYLSFVDTDEWGHLGNYNEYVRAIKKYDEWFLKLVNTLNGMGDYGKSTTILITTDHGRGEGDHWLYGWRRHGPEIPAARFVWFFGLSPATRARYAKGEGNPILHSAPAPYTHADIRPTIETIFGLKPNFSNVPGSGQSRIIAELFEKKEIRFPLANLNPRKLHNGQKGGGLFQEQRSARLETKAAARTPSGQ